MYDLDYKYRMSFMLFIDLSGHQTGNTIYPRPSTIGQSPSLAYQVNRTNLSSRPVAIFSEGGHFYE